MRALQNTKIVSAIKPDAAVNSGDFSANEIDTIGYDYATVVFQFGTAAAELTYLSVQECDTTGGSFSDVTGAVVGSGENIDGDDSALPGADDDNSLCVLEIDLRDRKRFLKVKATAGSGDVYGSAFCILSKPKEAPVSVAERGAAEVLRV